METLAIVTATVLVFVFGASIGSFLNVVIYRIPAGLSLLHPPSRCPHCFHRLGKTENVPILGWLWLRGRCRWCQTPISVRYPLVEVTTAFLFLFVFWKFGFSLDSVGYWVFLSWLLVLSLIDLDTMTLPNVLTQSGLILGLSFQLLLGWQDTQLPSLSSRLANHLMTGIAGAILGIILFDLILIVGSLVFGKPAMGGGDPKLAAMIGAWLGWQSLLLSGFLACGIGAIVGGGAIALGLLKRQHPMPFGPFLALGAMIALFWGETLIASYLRIFIPLS